MSILGIGLHLALMAPTIMSTRHILSEAMPVEALHRMVEPVDHMLSGWLIMTAAFAPALGAAIASINNQGEFSRLSKRSRAMEQIFKRFGDQIDRMRDLATSDGRAITLAAVSALATQIAERMIEENLDWRVVVLDLPHVSG